MRTRNFESSFVPRKQGELHPNNSSWGAIVMGRVSLLTTALTVVLVGVIPFAGGGGPGFTDIATAQSEVRSQPFGSTSTELVMQRTSAVVTTSTEESLAAERVTGGTARSVDSDRPAPKAVSKPKPIVVTVPGGGSVSIVAIRAAYAAAGQACPSDVGGSVAGAPSRTSPLGVAGTTSSDLVSFAYAYNTIRVANCLQPFPLSNFRSDSCMEDRLFWMAESPSSDPLDGWGHNGTRRSDGVPTRGCDGNLAGGTNDTGATAASKWWTSSAHRASLYRPGASIAGACIVVAITHGGIDEPYSFTRAAARWMWC